MKCSQSDCRQMSWAYLRSLLWTSCFIVWCLATSLLCSFLLGRRQGGHLVPSVLTGVMRGDQNMCHFLSKWPKYCTCALASPRLHPEAWLLIWNLVCLLQSSISSLNCNEGLGSVDFSRVAPWLYNTWTKSAKRLEYDSTVSCSVKLQYIITAAGLSCAWVC